MLITTEGIVIRMNTDDISVIGRNTSGVKLMRIDDNSLVRIASVAKVYLTEPEMDDEDETVQEEAEDAADSKISSDGEMTEDEGTDDNGMRDELLKRAFDDQNDQKQED